ncbi:hypothetical protein CANINC_004719 [Pichia inconspicua]|uniref:R3H domain-containing protein n=1 Tax=Pichia inconspicua TaxID=52247 RepID=A0A4T0WX80_9ASCO|nr:hypothetical protein CANINC_004719 [[Candida] inconspicua]
MTNTSTKENNIIDTRSVAVEDEPYKELEQTQPNENIKFIELENISKNKYNRKQLADTTENHETEENLPNINDYDIEEIELDETLSALANAEIMSKHYQVPNIIIKSLFNLNFNKKKPFTNRYGNFGKSNSNEDDVSNFLLALEKQIVEFVLKSEQDSLKLSPMNSYYRLLSHQLADYYHLGHILSSMVLYKINTSLINADDETKRHAEFDESGNIKPLDFKSLKFDPKEKLNRIKLSEIYERHKDFFEKYRDSLVNEFENLNLINSTPIIPYPDSFYPNSNLQSQLSTGNHRDINGRDSDFDDSEDDAEIIVGDDSSVSQNETDSNSKQRNRRRSKGYVHREYNNQYYYQPYGCYGGPPGSHLTQQPIYPNVVPMPGVIPVASPPLGSPAVSAPYYYYPVMPAVNTDNSREETSENAASCENTEDGSPVTPSTQSPGSPVGPQILNQATYSPVVPMPSLSGIPQVLPNGLGINPRGVYSYQYYPVPGPPGSAPLPMMYYDNNNGYSNRGGKRYNRRGRHGRHGDKFVETS